ncbi:MULTISPECIES: LuxR C-terminal-related transcriptional regulator [unclassified Microbacterium]|uniref:LuxR C-terminal-related transcriptional regulator n=1 Tax=unclassified Microbacterium TaxID=2609290 RepID=UPI00214C2249|nr:MULTISPECIES: LuxR C-terminal-related transcriptional regulator [unclassified Microbacterium]MCR2810584.1 LuxR C-terminal-related transcriptional regulator [Microbacterium sp. zg.B185]WIM18121.1 LuxR C-terminal-related transcriptional regulator [Microbacterium sp. zg-B185]
MAARTGTETETELVARAVADLTRKTAFPVAFGGLERDGAVAVTATAGTRTRSLDGLVVHATRGLGGRALVEKRPRLALDYRTSRNITHDYDRAVLGEGIATLFAIPVLVGGTARGVLYCGTWSEVPVGDMVTRPAFTVADALSSELRIRDEVERRMALVPPAPDTWGLDAAAREELRESYAELRSIASVVKDVHLRKRLELLEKRIAAISNDDTGTPADFAIALSPREIDVLSRVALGATNAEIASGLALKEGTVKSYLQAAMAKLEASTRHAAVAKARRAGILP